VKLFKPILLAACVLLIGFGLWQLFFPPPEKLIRKRLEALAGSISARPEGNIAKVSNANRIGSFFHPDVSISLEGFGREVSSLQGRGELEQMAFAARQNQVAINVQFYNIHVQVEPDKSGASAVFTAIVKINDRSDPAIQDIRATLEKLEGKWLIRSVTPTKVFMK
jgi:hypothetical protein